MAREDVTLQLLKYGYCMHVEYNPPFIFIVHFVPPATYRLRWDAFMARLVFDHEPTSKELWRAVRTRFKHVVVGGSVEHGITITSVVT